MHFDFSGNDIEVKMLLKTASEEGLLKLLIKLQDFDGKWQNNKALYNLLLQHKVLDKKVTFAKWVEKNKTNAASTQFVVELIEKMFPEKLSQLVLILNKARTFVNREKEKKNKG